MPNPLYHQFGAQFYIFKSFEALFAVTGFSLNGLFYFHLSLKSLFLAFALLIIFRNRSTLLKRDGIALLAMLSFFDCLSTLPTFQLNGYRLYLNFYG